ncbi:MAG TPA: hypothetical protein PK760_13785, partial [Flavobacteriales bacterium]|nr:hypothetical protein [Flavobacteriales bacterium]
MKKVKHRSGKAGLPPGSLIHVGEQLAATSTMNLFVYNELTVEERPLAGLGEYTDHDPEKCVAWLDIDGLSSDSMLTTIGERFNLHPLLL